MSKSVNLKYKASNIARAERESGRKFFDVFGELGNGAPSFDTLLFMLRAGGASEDEADEIIDTKGVGEAMIMSIEALSESGFLGEMNIDVTEMRKAIQEAQDEAKAASQSTGETKKA